MQFIQNGIRYNSIANGKVTVAGFGLNMDSAHVNIPHYTEKGYMVVSISSEAFAENTTIKSICIPNTVCSIGEKAFYKCSNLETFTMSTLDELSYLGIEEDALLSIHEKAFSGCKSLSNFMVKKPIELLGASTFKNCSLLTKIDGKLCGNLPEKSFYNCFMFSEFHFCDEKTSVGTDCFVGCLNMKDFYIEVDIDLNEAFFNNFKHCRFHCNPESKYLSLAYSGYHICKILNRV